MNEPTSTESVAPNGSRRLTVDATRSSPFPAPLTSIGKRTAGGCSVYPTSSGPLLAVLAAAISNSRGHTRPRESVPLVALYLAHGSGRARREDRTRPRARGPRRARDR